MSTDPNKTTKRKVITWDALRTRSVEAQREYLLARTPGKYKEPIKEMLRSSGLGKHDLALPSIYLEIEKLRVAEYHFIQSNKITKDCATSIRNDVSGLAAQATTQNAELKAILEKQEVHLRQISKALQPILNKYVDESSNLSSTSKPKIAMKQKWQEWIQSPTGISIAVLILILIFK